MLWPLCIQPYRLLMSPHLTKPNKRLKKEGTWWFFLACTGSAQTWNNTWPHLERMPYVCRSNKHPSNPEEIIATSERSIGNSNH